MDQQFEHLSDAQIESYGDRTGAGPNQPDSSLDQAIERHLEACDACRTRLLAFHRSRFSLTSAQTSPTPDFPATPNCPSEDSLRNLAVGLVPDADSATLMQHVAQCDHCGPVLRAYTEDFSDELSPADQALLNQLNSASPSWQNKIARQMAEAGSAHPISSVSTSASPAIQQSASKNDRVAQPSSAVRTRPPVLDKNEITASVPEPPSTRTHIKPSRFRLPSLKWLLVPAGAIACALIAFFIWNAQRETPEKVEKLLAQAYTEQRTMEMRIPYAAHADFKQTRGDNASLLSSPEALRKATDVIAANLKKNPDDPQWLLLSARLDLLDWNYRPALKTLDRLTFDPIGSSPQYALSRGLALYEKAEIESPGRQSYAEAVDWFGKALHEQPNNTVALFNQAVACEKILAFDCASSNWELLLRVEKDPGWISEARQHLAAIQEKKTSDR